MADNENLELENEENEELGSASMTLEELVEENKNLKAERTDLRKEAAKYRVKGKEKEAELVEFQKWKDSQKSELERAQEENAKLKEANHSFLFERRQLDAAKEAGLDLDMADRIRGDSDEELLEDAKALAEKFPKGSSNGSGTSSHAGRRGETVTGKKASSGADFLKQLSDRL